MDESSFSNEILENMNDALISIDHNFKVIYLNSAAEKITGRKKGDIKGQELLEAFPQAKGTILHEKYLELKKTRKNLEFEIKFNTTPFDKWFMVRVFADANKFNIFFSDITKQKEAEKLLKESEIKYRLLVENAQEGIWAVDREWKTSYVNQRIADILGYTVEEMLGRPLFSFMTPEEVELAQHYMERREQGIREQHDFEFLCKDGDKVYTSLETSPIYDDDNYIGAVAFVADITARRKAEKSLRERNAQIEAIFASLGDAVIIMNKDGEFFM